ncbi:hypothetical protein [Pontibacillus litoralis]|uniref:Uncharacterized protein n=1 Tax=Pontibacillus litoralis JSM 072002 TaxID=1385512 RepID=A0A0A5FZU8_9BACI|nr:hypothetical protein [Pontibacillus litoralis]KGX86356.1 hypothetical protein N784_05240 [Pontibacillus litoralis JSM 072002]
MPVEEQQHWKVMMEEIIELTNETELTCAKDVVEEMVARLQASSVHQHS